jgi:plastocyanin
MPGPGRSLVIALCLLLGGRGALAQSVLDRPPNMAGSWIGPAGALHFNFLHRFFVSPAPERKVSNTPTFLLAAGLPYRILLGAHYATNSELAPRYPNEWELFGRVAPLQQYSGAPVDASVQVGYNLSAKGLDGEAAIARRQGRIRVLAALRLLADPGADGGTDVAVATGAVLRLTQHVGVSADVATLTKRSAGEKVAWGVGLNLAIPRTPHSISLQATNVNNVTLQSASRGTSQTRYGFEFTIPITLSRYFGGGTPTPKARPEPAPNAGPAQPAATPPAGRDTVRAAVEDFAFVPARIEVSAGTTIVWTNRGQVTHTVTADDGSFESGNIDPGKQRGLTFARAGTFPFHCTPHPFMKGVIVVR